MYFVGIYPVRSIFRNKNSSVRNIVSKGQLNHSEIDQIIKNSLIYPGSGPGHLLRDLEKMLNQNPQGINHILGNIKTPNRSNFLGAEWVLRYICDGANPQRLRGLSRLELPTAGGSRIYDAVINGIRYEFKNLQAFNSSGFMTQIAKDFRNDPTLSSVRWIYSSRVGDKADLIAQMRQSLRNRSLLSANNLTRAQGRSIIAELNNFVDVGIKL